MFKKVSLLAAGLLVSVAAWAVPTVEMTTNLGKITLELFPEKAPKTVEMFLYNAKHGFYEATIFHRVIDGFMIQGGGFTEKMEEKPTREPIENEAGNGLKNTVGTLAMARKPSPNSATAQFFVNLVDNAFLNHTSDSPQGFGYAVFGKVTSGLDVVQKIAKVKTGNAGIFEDVPKEPVVIQSVKLISSK